MLRSTFYSLCLSHDLFWTLSPNTLTLNLTHLGQLFFPSREDGERHEKPMGGFRSLIEPTTRHWDSALKRPVLSTAAHHVLRTDKAGMKPTRCAQLHRKWKALGIQGAEPGWEPVVFTSTFNTKWIRPSPPASRPLVSPEKRWDWVLGNWPGLQHTAWELMI